MDAELFSSLVDADSLGQSQRFVLIGLGVAGAGLLHRVCLSCHGSHRAVYRLTGCPLELGKIKTGPQRGGDTLVKNAGCKNTNGVVKLKFSL